MTARRYPTPKEKAAIIARQGGICACGCGAALDGGKVEFDHELDLWTHGRNDTANFRALLAPCHKAKTAKDAKARAKSKRIIAKADPVTRAARQAKKATIRSPGFDKTRRRKMDGTVVARTGKAKMS
jgi:5-methylcytosine-specific restriction endonuclease McrA